MCLEIYHITEDNLISNIAFGQIENFYDINKAKEVIDKINLKEFLIKMRMTLI